MTHIATYFSDPCYDDYPFDDQEYVGAYHELARTCERKGSTFSIVRHMSTYLGGNEFEGGWVYRNGVFVRTESVIEADVIYNKGKTFRPTANANSVNSDTFQRFCADKLKVYCLFPQLSPLSFFVDCHEDLDTVKEFLPGDRIIIKPIGGFGGKGIMVCDKDDVPGDDVFAPSIVQELLDFSGGIPGLTDGAHDFRIVVADGKVLLTFIRVPASGRVLANVSQGGSVIMVPEELRPEGALALVDPVEKVFSHFGKRLYSIDCGRTKDGTWKIIELNDQPGLMTRKECGILADAYYDSLADFLITSAPTLVDTTKKELVAA